MLLLDFTIICFTYYLILTKKIYIYIFHLLSKIIIISINSTNICFNNNNFNYNDDHDGDDEMKLEVIKRNSNIYLFCELKNIKIFV